jgi:archaeoflavoprotein AfpA
MGLISQVSGVYLMSKPFKKPKVAWGITGSGDRLTEIIERMKTVYDLYKDQVEIRIYLSAAGEQVIRYYRLSEYLQENFGRVQVEQNSNSPFLAGALQLGRFKFLVIAPATSNTVAKIRLGIADTLLCNSALMALKAFIPVYLLPSDYQEGIITTKLPTGQDLKLRIRKEDVEHVRKLENMEGVGILKTPEEIHDLFQRYFK